MNSETYSPNKRNKRAGLVCGVGINDANYAVSKCVFYKKWSDMIRRCYAKKRKNISACYDVCEVASDWKRFSVFKSWMELQDYEGLDLDKDLLVSGNKVYGPETCMFIPHEVNVLIAVKQSGPYPLGVTVDRRDKKLSYRARISGRDLGYFHHPAIAGKAYNIALGNVLEDEAKKHSGKLKSALLKKAASLRFDSTITAK